jgi:hypothetical protein
MEDFSIMLCQRKTKDTTENIARTEFLFCFVPSRSDRGASLTYQTAMSFRILRRGVLQASMLAMGAFRQWRVVVIPRQLLVLGVVCSRALCHGDLNERQICKRNLFSSHLSQRVSGDAFDQAATYRSHLPAEVLDEIPTDTMMIRRLNAGKLD